MSNTRGDSKAASLDSATAGSTAVKLSNVSRQVASFDDQDKKHTILNGIDLQIDRGRILSIVGPSGCGKSSLLRIINRLDEPTSGSVELLGRALNDWPVRDLRRTAPLLAQECSLLQRTLRQNLLLPFEIVGQVPDDIDTQIERALQLAQLDIALLERTAETLSVGQRQRVGIARALMLTPQVFLLDEPTASLDPRTAESLLAAIVKLRDETSMTVLCVTHRLEEIKQFADDLLVLIEGRVAAFGPAQQMLDSPPNDEVCRFLLGGECDA